MALINATVQAACFFLSCGLLLVLGYAAGRHSALPQRLGSARGKSSLNEPLGTHAAGNDTVLDFDPSNLTEALLDRLRAARTAVASRPAAALAAAGAAEAQKSAAEGLRAATLETLATLMASFSQQERPKLVRALGLLESADEAVHSAWLALLPVTAERLGAEREAVEGKLASRTTPKGPSTLSVEVTAKPFGMHVKRGTALVAEVFPGFRAEAAGVRKGCELKEIAGKKVEAGTWLETFQNSPLPFMMKFSCAATASPAVAKGALSENQHTYRVMVTKKPYGMNIQVVTRPRVVEVLPGYPAEAAGVQRGFVLTEVNEVPVDKDNWFEEYQTAKLPFTLTFDTQVPVQPNNPFFTPEEEDSAGEDESLENSTATPAEEPLPTEGFVDFSCSVSSMPFGMQVAGSPHKRPRVNTVLPKSPAARAGVQKGDILVEVAGRAVHSGNWFAALRQAIPPFGILLRRPRGNETSKVAGGNAVPPHAGSGHMAEPPPAGAQPTAAAAAPAAVASTAAPSASNATGGAAPSAASGSKATPQPFARSRSEAGGLRRLLPAVVV